MKAVLKANELKRIVKICANTCDTRDSVRSNIAFRTSGQEMVIEASNSQYSVRFTCPATAEEDGISVVDGGMAYNAIASISGECTLTSDGKSLTVKGTGRTKLPDIGREIMLIEQANGKRFTCDSVSFKSAFDKVKYAISEDNTRIILTGVKVESKDGQLTFTAIDGFKLAQVKMTCSGDNFVVVIPGKILSAVCDAITEGEMVLSYENGHVTFVSDNFQINSVALTGDFIDVDRILPTEFATEVLVKTSQFADALRQAIVGSGETNLVKLNFSDGKLVITGDSEKAAYNAEIEADIHGDGFPISFNLKFINKTLSAIDTENLIIHLNSSVAPAVFTPKRENNTEVHLLLPVRTFS